MKAETVMGASWRNLEVDVRELRGHLEGPPPEDGKLHRRPPVNPDPLEQGLPNHLELGQRWGGGFLRHPGQRCAGRGERVGDHPSAWRAVELIPDRGPAALAGAPLDGAVLLDGRFCRRGERRGERLAPAVATARSARGFGAVEALWTDRLGGRDPMHTLGQARL